MKTNAQEVDAVIPQHETITTFAAVQINQTDKEKAKHHT